MDGDQILTAALFLLAVVALHHRYHLSGELAHAGTADFYAGGCSFSGFSRTASRSAATTCPRRRSSASGRDRALRVRRLPLLIGFPWSGPWRC